jgi:two-component sensor histidine kinase
MRTSIEGPEIVLDPNRAQTLAVIFHELATNAAKYGALSEPEGRIGVSWIRPVNGQLVLHWTEAGGPAVVPPARKGFGTKVVANIIRQARGEIRFDWHPAGLCCDITLPI